MSGMLTVQTVLNAIDSIAFAVHSGAKAAQQPITRIGVMNRGFFSMACRLPHP